MEVRKYIANSVAEGLISVREELGADAVILSVEENSKSLPAGSGKVQILAAPAEKKGEPKKAAKIPSNLGAALEARAAKIRKTKGTTPKEKELLERLYASQFARNSLSSRAGTLEQNTQAVQPAQNGRQQTSETFESVGSDYIANNETTKTEKISNNTRDESVPFTPPHIETDLPPEAASLYFYLIDTGIEKDIAKEMTGRLLAKINPRRGWNRKKVREILTGMIARQIRVGGQLNHIKKKRIVALIGPTGVGKTTTIAKLATKLVRNNVNVGLITVDHFRVGAVDQLRKFADTMHVPLLAASNKKDLSTAVRAFHSRQVILIDTAGQNPRDLELMTRLDQTLAVAGNSLERHLVLAAPTKERDLASFIELYNTIGFNYLLFSKLDETNTYGGLLNSYFFADRPYSYFTTGQQVPEDIEDASSEKLNNLLFH